MAAIPNGDEAMSVINQRSSKDIPYLSKDETEETRLRSLNDLIDQINYLSKSLSLKANFDGQIIENIQFSAGETKTIPHSLGVLPRYRVILRQEGNGVLDDIPSGWNKYQIKLRNNGAVSVIATIMLLRE
jgi:hypothetical protein